MSPVALTWRRGFLLLIGAQQPSRRDGEKKTNYVNWLTRISESVHRLRVGRSAFNIQERPGLSPGPLIKPAGGLFL